MIRIYCWQYMKIVRDMKGALRHSEWVMNIPTLISITPVAQAASWDNSPRITETHLIQTDDGRVEVDMWTLNGRVVKVSTPRPVIGGN